MRGISRNIRVGTALALAVLCGAMPVYAAAGTVATTVTLAEKAQVIITEFQTNGGSASQEFIELYNTTDTDIVFNDTAAGAPVWKLQFFSSTAVKTGAPNWATTMTASNSITLSGTISAHDYFLVASSGYTSSNMAADQTYEAASSHLMTDTGGGLQLLNGNTPAFTAQDRVMWLAAPAAGTSLPAGIYQSPPSGKSLQRQPDDDLGYVTAEGLLPPFITDDSITPLAAWQPPAPLFEEDVPGETPEETSAEPATDPVLTDVPADNTGLLAPQITELLPNPASPLTDAADEYIELYNPNAAPFNLKGYALEVGTTTKHLFTFTADASIAANSYVAFYSADTKLSLTNSGGQARLVNTAGNPVSESGVYTSAADNMAWVLSDGAWQWSTSATPGLANLLTIAPAITKPVTTKAQKTPAVKAATATKAKGTTTTKKVTTKKAATKAAAKKTAKKKAETKKTSSVSAVASTKPKPPIHTGILVAVAAAALLYGMYEYRHEVSAAFAKLRRNGSYRGSDRQRVARWGSAGAR